MAKWLYSFFQVATIISIYFDYRLTRGLPLDFSMSRTHRLNVRTYVVRHMQLVWQMELSCHGIFMHKLVWKCIKKIIDDGNVRGQKRKYKKRETNGKSSTSKIWLFGQLPFGSYSAIVASCTEARHRKNLLWIDSQSNRQTDRQIIRQTDNQTDRLTDYWGETDQCKDTDTKSRKNWVIERALRRETSKCVLIYLTFNANMKPFFPLMEILFLLRQYIFFIPVFFL